MDNTKPFSDDPEVVKRNFLRILKAYQSAESPDEKEAAVLKVLREIKQENTKR